VSWNVYHITLLIMNRPLQNSVYDVQYIC